MPINIIDDNPFGPNKNDDHKEGRNNFDDQKINDNVNNNNNNIQPEIIPDERADMPPPEIKSVTFGLDNNRAANPEYYFLNINQNGQNIDANEDYFRIQYIDRGWFKFEALKKDVEFLISGIPCNDFDDEIIIDNEDTVKIPTQNTLNEISWFERFRINDYPNIDNDVIHNWHRQKMEAHRKSNELNILKSEYEITIEKMRFNYKMLFSIALMLMLFFLIWQFENITLMIYNQFETIKSRNLKDNMVWIGGLVFSVGGSALLWNRPFIKLIVLAIFSKENDLESYYEMGEILSSGKRPFLEDGKSFKERFKSYKDNLAKFNEKYNNFPCPNNNCNDFLDKEFWRNIENAFKESILQNATGVVCPKCNHISPY